MSTYNINHFKDSATNDLFYFQDDTFGNTIAGLGNYSSTAIFSGTTALATLATGYYTNAMSPITLNKTYSANNKSYIKIGSLVDDEYTWIAGVGTSAIAALVQAGLGYTSIVGKAEIDINWNGTIEELGSLSIVPDDSTKGPAYIIVSAEATTSSGTSDVIFVFTNVLDTPLSLQIYDYDSTLSGTRTIDNAGIKKGKILPNNSKPVTGDQVYTALGGYNLVIDSTGSSSPTSPNAITFVTAGSYKGIWVGSVKVGELNS